MADWKSELKDVLQKREDQDKIKEAAIDKTTLEVERFYQTVVTAAFDELKDELENHGRVVTVSVVRDAGSIEVSRDMQRELHYSIKVRGAHPYPETRFRDSSDGKVYRAEGYFRSGLQNYTVTEITKEEIIANFLENYKQHIRS